MKVQILSDLHQEFGPAFDIPNLGDIIIIAGDTHIKTRGIPWVKNNFPGKTVLYLAGNHEFYKGELGREVEKLKEAAKGSDIIVLENESVEIGGWRFFGATLWTDFNLKGQSPIDKLEAQFKMSDYKQIRTFPQNSKWPTAQPGTPTWDKFRKIQPNDLERLHVQSRRKIEDWLEQGPREKSVVITHHAPSGKSIPEKFHGDSANPAYAANLDALIYYKGPAFWIHGHIHEAADYEIGQTRIIANPHGYPGQKVTNGFKPNLVIDLP